jgi:hypothetical protein
MISMNQIWDDSIAFIRRESALLVPLAFATIYVADVVAGLAQSMAKPTDPNPVVPIAILAAALWSVIGQLSIVSLVLKPGQSVGEALSHGLSRLGKVILIALLLGLVVSVALLPVAVAAVASGANPAKPESLQNLPGWVSLMMLVVTGGLIWLGVRLALMNALIVDRNPGVIEALKGGFALTRGITARLFLVVLLYGVVLLVMGAAVKYVAGTMFELLARLLESPLVGTALTALVTGLVSTAMSLIATVFLATLYRRVSSGT